MRTHTFSQTINMHSLLLYIIAAVVLIAQSCSSFLLPPLEIIEVHTGSYITVVFSQRPAKDSVERAFKITENGNEKSGRLSFNDERVIFYPDLPFRTDAEYILTVTTAAETDKGLSLAQTYVKKFTGKPEHIAPRVVSVLPADNQVIDDSYTSLTIHFSEAVDTVSCIKALSFEPSFKWVSSFSPDKKSITVIFSEQLLRGKRYKMTVSTELQDIYGNALINPYISSFYYGNDISPPDYTVSFQNAALVQEYLSENTQTHNVPLNARLSITCNEKINTDTVQNLISFTPPLQAAITVDTENANSIFIDLKDKAQWNTPYTMRIKKGISDVYGNILQEDRYFRFICDSEKNRPVKIIAGFFEIFVDKTGTERFLSIKEEEPYQSFLLKVEDFPTTATGNEKDAVLYYVVDHSAESHAILLLSAMESIRISATNACISITQKNIGIHEITDSEVQDIKPFIDAFPPGTIGGKLSVIKISTEIRNKTPAGTVTFSIQKLRDDLGNLMQKDWIIPLNKQ